MVYAAFSMETIVDIVGNEEVRFKDVVPSPQKTADPVVYQLVRVDGNGRLVPATDDEVIVVENLLEDDKSEGRNVTNTGKTLECNTSFGCTPENVQFNSSEGLQQVEDTEIGAENPNVPPDPALGSGNMDVQLEERIPSVVPINSDDNLGQCGSPEGCSNLSGSLLENRSSSSFNATNSQPDFSLVKGEIHLDNLSVRDLQETFKATFGRETSVKDKQWLKRRIVMGLTNSCDFSATTLIITDHSVVKKGKEEAYKSENQSVLVDCVVRSAEENHEVTPTSHDKENEIQSNAKETKIESCTSQDKCISKDADTERRPAKRVRKPTKRYIEELSEEESRDSGAKMVSPVKQPVPDHPSAKVFARPSDSFGLDGRCLTRKDSLGGSGVQVPYVSRIRRSRPRENFMTLMKIQPSGMGMSNRFIEKDVASSEQLDNGSVNDVPKASLSRKWPQEPAFPSAERSKLFSERKAMQMEKEVELENMDSYKNSSDDEVVTVPTTSGGMRRKHHRPWTLTEVVKLVDGVAKYGVGRWSEIKRLAFASYSYRTSVDLKDKWRNLLRASLAELPARNGTNSSRKQASVPIPAPILSRVRELADIQTQVPLSPTSSKFAGYNNDSIRSVHETRSGFL